MPLPGQSSASFNILQHTSLEHLSECLVPRVQPEHVFLLCGAEAHHRVRTDSLHVHSTAVVVPAEASGKHSSPLFCALLRFDLTPNSLFLLLSTLR